MKKEMDPRMHSAEHLLNQAMVRMFNCGRCFSSHIEKKKSKCDYHFERDLEEQEEEEIQNRVNRVIQADLAVTEAYVNRGEGKEHYNLDRLPEDAGDLIRIIKIGDYDACPCVGPHVHSTKEIGGFRIVSTGFENGVLRIRYKLDKSPQKV
jgi:misacylated tRNA(Ala) deacylase